METKSSIRNSVTAILLMALFWAVTMPVKAASANDKIRLGVYESDGMFNLTADGEVSSGYCYDYMMQIANYTGWDYEFVYGSFPQLYGMLRDGQIDMLPYTNLNSQREKEVLFSAQPLVQEEYYIVTSHSSTHVDSQGMLLDGATITSVEQADYNSMLADYLRENGIKAKISYCQYLEESWEAVRSGRADATIWTSISYSDDNWNNIIPIGRKPTYIGVSRKRTDLLERLDQVSDLIDKEIPAFKDNLYIKYFHNNPLRKVLSEEEQQWIAAHPILHVGCFTNDAPYVIQSDPEARTAVGLAPSVLEAIFDRLGLDMKADYQCYRSMDQIEAALDSGKIDVIVPFYPNPYIAQKHGLVSSNKISSINMDLIFRTGSNYQEATRKIAAQGTKLSVLYLEDNFPNSEKISTGSIHDAVDLVVSGEATGALAQNIVTKSLLEDYDNLSSMVLPNGCNTCFATRLEDYPLIRILNRGLLFIPDSEIAAISAQYSTRMPVSVREFLSWHTGIVISIIIILVTLVALIITIINVIRLKKKADAANLSKTTFLFNMSHDIRTPMNAIMGFTSMAKKELRNPERVNGFLEKIDLAGNQLLVLINQVLEMARIESGRIEFNESEVDLQKQYDSFVTVLAEQAKERGVHFNHSLIDVTHFNIMADVARVGQITLNIAGNAIKYTPQGGHIDFTLREIEPRRSGYASFVFTVADTGIGMSEEYQKVLFEPFTRENSSTVSHIQGTGLGMSIVKHLVDLAGGNIAVKSEPGKGSRFDITLDFRISTAAPSQDSAQSDSQPASMRFEGKRVLMVEDNELNREIARYILEDRGLEVEEAVDGNFAVDIIDNLFAKGDYTHFDMIIMDIQMPTMNGYDATKAIRRICEKVEIHIPIIALSANAFEEDRRKSHEAGMDDHLAKPIDTDKLNEVLARFLK